MFSIYECPHCHKRAFNPITKAFAGQINSKGKPCKYCGKRCCNGMGSTIFHTIIDLAVLILAVVCWIGNYDFGLSITIGGNVIKGPYLVIAIGIVAAFVVNKLFDAFFLKLTKPARIDAH